MNKKEKRDLQKNWIFVSLAAILSFFISIASSLFYDLFFKDGSIKKLLFPLVFFSGVSFFIIGFFSYLFDRVDELKDNTKTLWYFIYKYIKTWF